MEVDRRALAKYADAAEKIVKAYDDYDYPAIFQIANQLITVDLSAFYVDVTKDRMYTFGAKSEARRSGQTAMFTIVEGLARLLAPILSVTMDELWRMLPGAREESVHMALFPRGSTSGETTHCSSGMPFRITGTTSTCSWKRNEKTRASLRTCPRRFESLLMATTRNGCWQQRDFLPTLFGVSGVELVEGPFAVSVEPATGTKCERCWRFVPEVSAEPDRAGLCPRCVEALAEPVSL